MTSEERERQHREGGIMITVHPERVGLVGGRRGRSYTDLAFVRTPQIVRNRIPRDKEGVFGL